MKVEIRHHPQRLTAACPRPVTFVVRVVLKNQRRQKMSADFAPMKTHWMLVDDDADILRVLAAVVVTITDAEIETFCSASEAFAAFAAEPEKYQLVITDYEMPEMDGVELCRRMRVLVLNQNIFLASGGGFFTDAVAGRTGFGALLNKPFPISALREDWAKTFLKNESACAA